MRWTCVAALLQVWGRCEALTAGLSSDLAEQLRLVLEPQLASKMAGEYRTGKRISMKRVIAYIASHFRKDKIWLRRTRPDKRTSVNIRRVHKLSLSVSWVGDLFSLSHIVLLSC